MIKNYEDFIFEGQLAAFKKNIEISFEIDADNHYYDQTSRSDNEPDESGSILIKDKEVIDDINKAIPFIVKKNLFNNGLYWKNDPINRDRLNKDILIKNLTTNLNIVIMISKYINKEDFIYKITVKTVMRNRNFVISLKQNPTEKIEIK